MKKYLLLLLIIISITGCSQKANVTLTKSDEMNDERAIKNLKLYGKYSQVILSKLEKTAYFAKKEREFEEEAKKLIKTKKDVMNKKLSKEEDYYEEFYDSIIAY